MTWLDALNAVLIGVGCSLFYRAGYLAGGRRQHRLWVATVESWLQAHPAPTADSSAEPPTASERG